MSWQHHNPVQVTAGVGSLHHMAHHLPGGSVLLLTTPGMLARDWPTALTSLRQRCEVVCIAPNPELDALDALAHQWVGHAFSAVLGIGGGSVLDAGKALSVLLASPRQGTLARHFRASETLDFQSSLPFYAVPTTAGTGAEVTPFATIWDHTQRKKYSLHHPRLFAKHAFLDPTLTQSLSWAQTLWGALDALSHSLETLWNRHATPLSGASALQALDLITTHLPAVRTAPNDLHHRAQLQNASFLAGMAISQSRTALAHSMSYPLTAHFDMPHGLACGFTLAALIRHVRQHHGWVIEPPEALIDKTLHVLASLELGAQAQRHCDARAALACVAEMNDAQRATNFSLPVSQTLITQVLCESLPHARSLP